VTATAHPRRSRAPTTGPSFLGRIETLRALVDEVAPAAWLDPRWWALVSAVAAIETRPSASAYLVNDAGPRGDTFMAWAAPRPRDVVAEAVALARAARAALADLDGALVDQPLAGTIAIGHGGARMTPVALDAVAIAAGDRVALAPLGAPDAALVAALAAFVETGEVTGPLLPLGARRAFCTIAIGDDAWATARHGHRRGWIDPASGPWLGLARIGDHLVASTCHYAIDGYGHALLVAALAAATSGAAAAAAPGPVRRVPPLAPVRGVAPLAFASRAWPSERARAVQVAYRAGCLLGAELGTRRGMSPTIQIPVAPGRKDDPDRWRRRVLPAVVSVRWDGEHPEPFERFARRARAAIAREAAGDGLASRVNAAGRGLPVPVRWKRTAATPAAAPSMWIAPLYDILAGRACVSVIRPPAGVPAIAASVPARADAVGATVITIVDAGAAGATITVTGTGRWGTDAACARVIDQLLQR
jgi:hypothetical protein